VARVEGGGVRVEVLDLSLVEGGLMMP